MPQVLELGATERGQSTLTAATAIQRITREWMAHLTANEFAVLVQLVDRTLGWQKTRASFSINRLVDGDTVYAGIGHAVSRASIFRALASLEEKGMIGRHRHPQGKQIRVYSVNMGWSPVSLNIPKRLQNGQSKPKTSINVRRDQSHSDTGPVSHCATGDSNLGDNIWDTSEDGPEQPAAIPASSDPDEVIRKAMSDVKSRRRAAPVKPKTLPEQMRVAEAGWREAVEEAHPTGAMLAWSVRERAMVKAKLKGWQSDRASFTEFLNWCAINWALVCRKQLGWMKKPSPPKTPEIGFLIGFIDRFHEAFADADLTKWMNAAQTKEYDKLIAKGMTHDEAVHRMAKQDAVDETRDEVRKGKQEIAIQRGVLAKREARIEARARPAPIHPKSKAAQRIREERKVMSQTELDAIDINDVPLLDPNWEPDA